MSIPCAGKTIVAGLFISWFLLNSLIVLTEARFPGSDIFLFKEAGINLAMKGRLVASNIVHMPADAELPFAFYPPLYPACFGLWSRLFGIGLKQSLVFECFLRGLRTFLLCLLLWPYIKATLKDRMRWKDGLLAATVLLTLSMLSTDNDRPEELALIFGLSCWIAIRKKGWPWNLLAGFLLGVTGATSPAGGVFFTLGVLFESWKADRFCKRVGICAVTALLTFALVNLPVQLQDPSAYRRFSIQAFQSTLPYVIPFVGGSGISGFVKTFSAALEGSFRMGAPYIFCLLVVGSLPLMLSGRKSAWRPLIFSSLAFVPLSLFLWSLQPYYLWFSCVVLVGGALSSYLALGSRAKLRHFWAMGILTALFPLAFRESKAVLNALQRPPEESRSYVQARVLSYVRPGERIAVSFDQFFTFRKQREVVDIGHVCARLDHFHYVYVTRIQSSHRGYQMPIPCEKKASCFTALRDFTSHKVFHIFGFPTPYFVRGNGGVLYKNTICASSVRNLAGNGF